MRRCLAVFALLCACVLLIGCNGVTIPPGIIPTPPPVSPPTIPPTPPPEAPPACADLGVPWCHETTPPMTCGECKHQPPGEACPVKAPACAPAPPPAPPVPPPVQGHGQALLVDEDLKPTDLKGPTMWVELWAASDRYKAAHPEDWNPELTCLKAKAAGIDRAYEGISAQLAVRAAQSFNTARQQRSDCIFVNRPSTDLFEQFRLFEYGRGCEATGPTKEFAVWRYETAEAPPPVADLCPATPCPEKTYPDGKPRWKYNAKAHTMKNGDSTPVLIDQCAYCASVGLREIGGVMRCTCPVRVDEHPDREALEEWLTGGRTRDSRNGQDCTPNNTTNPAAFLWGTGNCRMCSKDLKVCSEWH